MRIRLWLPALALLFPALAWGADFNQVAGEIRQDLARAEREQKEAEVRLTQKEQELKERLVALRAEMEAEQNALTQAQNALTQAHEIRQALGRELREAKGGLDELGGNLRSAGRDQLALAERSPRTAEAPENLPYLRGLIEQRSLPALSDIARLIDLYFDEIQAASQIASRQGELVDRFGVGQTARIVRLGGLSTLYQAGDEIGFALISPQSGRLLAAESGLPWLVERGLEGFMEGQSDDVYLDISAGAALRHMSGQDGLWERLLSGGPLVWPILLVGLIALVLICERFYYLQRVQAGITRLMDKTNTLVGRGDYKEAMALAQSASGRPTSKLIKAGLELQGRSSQTVENGLSEAMLRELPRMEKYLTALKMLAAVAPLLGLLGTVTGMINTFQVITLFGSGDPRLMAGGISEALITTQLGLAVAIPVMVAAALLGRRAQRLTGDMEEKAVVFSAALAGEGGS